ncbi:hypothetical protein [Demequina lutea]|uniref:Uncharacterized protein n=1 Tax=Demequina lutea TaxID=431489 RepID=A0A7Y9ZEV8_9MICO|nr:hypothetical protein [Demequina lutea]NYI42685.1 hypothetical protein [Demequina lutea]
MAVIRAVEAVIALVLTVVLYHFASAGALTSLGHSVTGWYSHQVDGLFTISVIDKSVKPPQLDKANLPIALAPEASSGPNTPAST